MFLILYFYLSIKIPPFPLGGHVFSKLKALTSQNMFWKHSSYLMSVLKNICSFHYSFFIIKKICTIWVQCSGVVKNSYKNALRDQHQMCHCVRLYSIKQGKEGREAQLDMSLTFYVIKGQNVFWDLWNNLTVFFPSRHKTCELNENWSFLWFRNSLDMWKSYTRAS